METVEVGDIGVALGHTGRFEVTNLKNQLATIKLLAESVHGPVGVGYEMSEVPVSTLTI